MSLHKNSPCKDKDRRSVEQLDLDAVFERSSEFGCVQRILFVLISVHQLADAMSSLSPVFMADTPEFTCAQPHDLEPRSNRSVLLDHYSRLNGSALNGTSDEDRCYTRSVNSSGASSEVCRAWVFSKRQYESTIVTEWSLVCERRSMAYQIAAAYMIGKLLPCFIVGFVIDKFGRRNILIVTVLLKILCGLAGLWLPYFWWLLIMRCLQGIFQTISGTVSYILNSEIVSTRWRWFVSSYSNLGWAFGYILLAGYAFLIRDWRILQYVITVQDLIVPFIYLFILPESPRWLALKGKEKQLKTAFTKLTRKKNCDKIIDSLLTENNALLKIDEQKQETDESRHETWFRVWSYPRVWILTLVLFYAWFVNALTYYGLSLYSTRASGDDYLNFFIFGVVELVSYLAMPVLVTKLGRRCTISVSLLFCSLSLLFIAIIKDYSSVAVFVLMLKGKFMGNVSFNSIWLYTTELYPTSIRSSGVFTCSMIGRVGGIVASYIGMLGEFGEVIPFVFLGALGLPAAVMLLGLPETRNIQMKQSVQECDEFVKHNAGFHFRVCLCNRKRKFEEKECHQMDDRKPDV